MKTYRLSDLLLVPYVFGVAMFVSVIVTGNEDCASLASYLPWTPVSYLSAYPVFAMDREFGLIGKVSFWKWGMIGLAVAAIAAIVRLVVAAVG